MLEKMPRKPSHPGCVLKGLYMTPLKLTVAELAQRIGVSRKTLSRIVNGHISVSLDMALRFSQAFDSAPEVWLNMQMKYDLWEAQQTIKPTDKLPWQSIEPVYQAQHFDA